MSKPLRIAVIAVILLLCLTGCSKPEGVIGTWRDIDGYTVEFREDGTYIESIYGQPMKYSFEEEHLTYYWADGLQRKVPVNQKLNGNLRFRINGKDRVFSKTDKHVVCSYWRTNEVSLGKTITAKYKLLGDTGVSSELRLLSDGQYSLTYIKSSNPLENWKVVGPGVETGLYVNGLSDKMGADNYLILYKKDKTCTEVFKQSETGKYIGAMPLRGIVKNISQDYVSPVSWRGYAISETLADVSNDILYHFRSDHTVLKELSNGKTIKYSYFISPEGFVSLSCQDGILPSDNMYFDLYTGVMYRLVFERDSWADFIYQISDEKQAADRTIETEDSSNTALSHNQIKDAEYVTGFNNSISNLFFSYTPGASTFLSTINSAESYKSLLNYAILADQEAKAYAEKILQERAQEEFEQEMQEFLDWMEELLVQRKELEEGQTDSDRESIGDFSEEDEYSYLMSEVDQDDVSSINFEIQESLQSWDNVDEVTATTVKVQFFCNCETCHTADMLVPRGADAVALADSNVYSPSSYLLTGDNRNMQVFVMNSNGTVIGNRLDLYFTDHDWVHEQRDGQYTIRRILE